MKPPKRAVILGAGFGSRLSPLTLDCPKPLVPVGGGPMIGKILQQVKSWGVRDALVNIHHRADRMLEETPRWCPPGLRLNFSHEPVILGTGGALRRMEWFIGGEPFWICNADVLQELDPAPLLRAFGNERPLACLWMVRDTGPRTVKVEEGEVRDFRGGGLTFTGLHLASPELLEFLPEEERFFSVIEAYENGMAAGRKVLGIEVPGGRWMDVGTPEKLLQANGGSVVFPGARVEADAELDRALVGPCARIRKGRRVSGVVVSPERGLTETERGWLPEAEAVEALPARGSDRSFHRVHLPVDTVMLMRSGEARPENDRFVGHTRFLNRRGVRVPEILRVARDRRTVLLEDLGRVHLLDRLRSGSDTRNRRDMAKVVAMTARLHAIRLPAGLETEPPFSSALFGWEHELFAREFLERHDPKADAGPMLRDLEVASARLLEQPRVPAHRDLQSTNILWKDGEPALIDYQGLRPGPAAYDLASLLADPYAGRSREAQLRLLARYNRLAAVPVSEEIYACGAVQRLAQALGAYGRLGARLETRRFRDYIPAAVRQMGFWADAPALREWAERFLVRHREGNPVGLSSTRT